MTKLISDSPEIMEVDVTDTIEEAVNTINVRQKIDRPRLGLLGVRLKYWTVRGQA